MSIGIDLGNWNVKTSTGDIFSSRYTTVENLLGSNADIFEYEGIKYYMCEGQLENNYDKASKETNIILLLYALALQKENHFRVVVGLPISSYKANRDKFREKLLESKVHNIKLNGRAKTIVIEDVIVFPEGAGAYYSIQNRSKNAIIIDVGGGTTNIAGFKNCKLDKSTTLGKGMIELYSRIREYLNSTYTLKLELEDIEGIMRDGLKVDGEQISFNFLKDIVEEFTKQLMNELRNFDIRTAEVYLVGGGTKLLKGVLTNKIKGLKIIEDYLFSNAKGFKKIGDKKWKESE